MNRCIQDALHIGNAGIPVALVRAGVRAYCRVYRTIRSFYRVSLRMVSRIQPMSNFRFFQESAEFFGDKRRTIIAQQDFRTSMAIEPLFAKGRAKRGAANFANGGQHDVLAEDVENDKQVLIAPFATREWAYVVHRNHLPRCTGGA